MSFTVTTTGSPGAHVDCYLLVKVLDGGVEAGGQVASLHNANATAPFTSITPNGTNSLILWVATADAAATFTLEASNTQYGTTTADGDGWAGGYGFYSGAVTSGTPVTVGVATTTSSDDSTICAYEVKASGGSTPTVDASSPALVTASTTCTTAAFSPPVGSVLVAMFMVSSTGAAAASGTISDTSGLGLTWTARGVLGSCDDQVALIWTTTIPASSGGGLQFKGNSRSRVRRRHLGSWGAGSLAPAVPPSVFSSRRQSQLYAFYRRPQISQPVPRPTPIRLQPIRKPTLIIAVRPRPITKVPQGFISTNPPPIPPINTRAALRYPPAVRKPAPTLPPAQPPPAVPATVLGVNPAQRRIIVAYAARSKAALPAPPKLIPAQPPRTVRAYLRPQRTSQRQPIPTPLRIQAVRTVTRLPFLRRPTLQKFPQGFINTNPPPLPPGNIRLKPRWFALRPAKSAQFAPPVAILRQQATPNQQWKQNTARWFAIRPVKSPQIAPPTPFLRPQATPNDQARKNVARWFSTRKSATTQFIPPRPIIKPQPLAANRQALRYFAVSKKGTASIVRGAPPVQPRPRKPALPPQTRPRPARVAAPAVWKPVRIISRAVNFLLPGRKKAAQFPVAGGTIEVINPGAVIVTDALASGTVAVRNFLLSPVTVTDSATGGKVTVTDSDVSGTVIVTDKLASGTVIVTDKLAEPIGG